MYSLTPYYFELSAAPTPPLGSGIWSWPTWKKDMDLVHCHSAHDENR